MQNSNVTTAKLMGLAAIAAVFFSCNRKADAPIDRVALLERNSPVVTSLDTMASLTVGNGDFAMTVDVTGLQTFPEKYRNGVPLGTMSSWGWHSFANPEKYDPKEVLVAYDFGTGSKEALYSQQVNPKKDARKAAASDWLRANPHRLHLGNLGLFIDEGEKPEITDINQRLDLLTGVIQSDYKLNGKPVSVKTACSPDKDVIGISIESSEPLPLVLRIPGPTGKHSDDASDWLNTPDCLLTGNTFTVPYGFSIDIEGGKDCVLEQIDNNKVLISPRKHDNNLYNLSLRWRLSDKEGTSIPDANTVFAE
ncbi:MAG: glycoside hydrolase N-terminal domain-containing protein, partial [Bacteroidales bacterium]|nr:glycoside hydrolase N-terminal domain-containing protein [Bacteroidales bacterium]